jgi:hypothetical protein
MGIFFGILIVIIVIMIICVNSCPEGGKHDWRYVGHYLDLITMRCCKCGYEHEYCSEDDANRFEYEKNKQFRENLLEQIKYNGFK